MCVGCPDWIGACSKIECGARDPEETSRFLRHFYLGEPVCFHVMEEHHPRCRVSIGRVCNCWPDEEDDDAPRVIKVDGYDKYYENCYQCDGSGRDPYPSFWRFWNRWAERACTVCKGQGEIESD